MQYSLKLHLRQVIYARMDPLPFINGLDELEHVESFNGSFRDECLNAHWFLSMEDAKAKIEAWRIEYNERRPHRALNGLTPIAYAAKAP